MTNWPAVWAVFAGGRVAGAYMTRVPPALPQLRGELGLTLIESRPWSAKVSPRVVTKGGPRFARVGMARHVRTSRATR